MSNWSMTALSGEVSPVVKRHFARHVSEHHLGMDVRKVLGANLERLMSHEKARRRGLDSNAKVGKRVSLSSNTIGRIRRGENYVQLDTLAELASAFDLDAWQLLVPDIDPENPPALRSLSANEQALYDRLKAAVQAIENR